MEKIVFALPSIKTGGGNRVVIELANQLILKGISVDILYPNNSMDINTFKCHSDINFIKIGKFKSNKFNKLRNIFSIFKYLSKNYENEKIIFTDPIMSIFLPLIKNNIKYRFIQADDFRIFDDLLIFKNYFFLMIYKFLTKVSYKYKVNYIFNSQYTYDNFIQTSKRIDVDFKLVHPALNHDIFKNVNIRNGDEINLCLIARKHPWKGFIDFLLPFQKQLILPVSNVYVISHDDLSGFELDAIHVIKPKNDEEISHYMNLSHIFISTSWWEGFGLPPLEAMSCGNAVLVSKSGGVDEYATDNLNCLMYEPKNQEHLINQLNTLIRDRKLRNELSDSAKEISQQFCWEKSAVQLLNILNQNEN